MKIGEVRAELFYTDRRRDKQTEITNLTFHNFSKALNKTQRVLYVKSRAGLLLAKIKCTKSVFSTVCIPF